jgi:hypothetical protein
MDNWQECTQTCRGVMSLQMPINNQKGVGHETFDAALGAVASDSGVSESNHREFYRRWQEVMDAPSWDELARRGANRNGEARHA